MLSSSSSIAMSANPVSGFSPSISSLSNPIDLTGDDSECEDLAPQRKRMRSNEPCPDPRTVFAAVSPPTASPRAMLPSFASSFDTRPNSVKSISVPSRFVSSPTVDGNTTPPQPDVQRNIATQAYRPAFAAPLHPSTLLPPPPMHHFPLSMHMPSPLPSGSAAQVDNGKPVIDLTNSPSPPPSQQPTEHPTFHPLPRDLAPRTPVCIGMLPLNALVLYPHAYITPQAPDSSPEWEWARVRVFSNNNEANGMIPDQDVHISLPQIKMQDGKFMNGEVFGILEHRAAMILGPMLRKQLIRLEGKIQRGKPSLLPLKLLVFTPKGNVAAVGTFLQNSGLLLDHPTFPFDVAKFPNIYYSNPHNPPPGGHSRVANGSRNTLFLGNKWTASQVTSKSVQVDRNQVDEVFKSLRNGEDLGETEAPPQIGTCLYPHQKKALTFLLEREREKPGPDGTFTSLWQHRFDPQHRRPVWCHAITEKASFSEPPEFKGALLADDMGLGKTITCVSLIAATLDSSRSFASVPLPDIGPPPPKPMIQDQPPASHFTGSVWGMPIETSNKAAKAATRANEKAFAEYTRNSRVKARSRATLIICPLSTVVNWEDQLRDHWAGEVQVVGGSGSSSCAVPGANQTLLTMDTESGETKGLSFIRKKGTALRVYVYHGNARRPDSKFLADFDVVITTYSTLATEYSKQSRSLQTHDNDDEGDSSDEIIEVDEHGNQIIKLSSTKRSVKRKKFLSSCSAVEITSPLQTVYWFRVVLDEAHSIKETNTVCNRACCDLMADRRLCLTGTPIQNKIDDIFALIKFLRLEPFVDKTTWTEYIGSPAKLGQPIGITRLQLLMKSITLRRTKESKTSDGKNILSLPPRSDELRYLKFDEKEQAIYDQFFTESKAEFTEMTKKNEVMKHYVGILQKILRLRQICDHFQLVEGKGLDAPSSDSATSYDDIIAAIAAEGLTAARATAVFALLRDAGTAACVECGYELSAPEGTGLDFMGMEMEGGSSAKPRGRKGKSGASRSSTRPSSPLTPRPVLTRCQHLFCIACYRSCVCPGWPDVSIDTHRSCSACQAGLGPLDAVEVNSNPLASERPKKLTKKEKRAKEPIAERDFYPSTKVKALLADLIPFSRANPYSANYDREACEIQMVVQNGNEVVGEDIVKTVVFSQWTSMLDKVEDALRVAQIRYDRLDGTMKRDERNRAMDALKNDPGCEVLLVSLKAGGVGLNLTAAQRVYLMDPYWNPAVENQAVDRIHRLGQTRPVTTVKLIIENSIEARLLEVQKKKTELANMTLSQVPGKSELTKRRLDELQELFRA